jgi:hypothetical protein
MRNSTTKIVCMLILVFSARAICKETADAKKENPYLWKSKVASVTIFKNGLGFFLRQGQTQLRDGWCIAGAIPPASFGTLVIFPTDANRTVDTIGTGNGDTVEFDGIDAPDDIAVKRSRLQSCMYLKVQLSYLDNKKAGSAAGKVVSVGDDYVILDAENSNFAVPLEGITKLVVLENPLRIHVQSDDKKPAEKTTLAMAYLRKGITWIPEYTLKLLDEDTAELTLRGTLVNEAEDLINCDVQLVVGVPHFVHTDYLTPISVGQVIRTIGAAIAPPGFNQQISNSMISNIYTNAEPTNITSRPVTDSSGRNLQNTTGNLPRLESEGATDYTVYERKGVTLRVGEKAILTLFTKKIKYRHSYRWTLPNDIEHFLVLENNTDSAFTTGPCLVMSDNRALSEDMLKYTPRGSFGELPVTTAINIAKDQSEKETGRQKKVYSISTDYSADLVSLEGELKLRNYDKKEAAVNITMKIQGKPLTASDKGSIVQDTQNLKLLEQTGTITWQITVKPGETKTLTYTYERYVPSR